MRTLARVAATCVAALGLVIAAWAQFSTPATSTGASAAVVQTEQVRAELVAFAPEGVSAGKPLWVGLKIDHQPQWHTYWKNAGDS